MFTKPSVWIIRSDKDTHFTGALVTNAAEVEAITAPNILPDNNVRIHRVTVISDQNLAWDVMFLRGTTISPADLDLNPTVEWVSFAETDAVRVAGAGAYLYALTGLDIPYSVSPANPGALIIALINRDAAAKAAGAAGEVVIEVQGVSD